VREDLRAARSHFLWVEVTSQGIYRDANDRDAEGFLGSYGTARDVSARKEAEATINFQAYHDLLTHLPNRALLKDRLSLAVTQAARNGRTLAVLFLDLDRFKVVNDTLGHSVGDRLLQAVAGRLTGSLRAGDTLARFGGDEFTLLLPDLRSREDAGLIADKILDQLRRPFTVDGHELFVGASIGIAVYPESGRTEEALIQSADIAMYHVKTRGKNGFEFFSEAMNESLSSRLALERELRKALVADELEIHYQPLVSAANGRITGAEALVRWRHPVRGMLEPDAFLPIALETGLLPQLDRRVQCQALKDLARWRGAGHGELRLAVNVSAHQLELEQFVPQLLADVAEAGLDPSDLKLEITENLMLRDIDAVVPKLRTLRAAGIRIAIDDFGTGYSSLSYLRQFPVDALKVDRSFVADIRAETGDPSILDAIVAMARGLRLDLVAEGVENRVQLRRLVAMGCSELQGYVFSCPVDAERFADFLARQPFASLLASVREVLGTADG
jgi:diguanylate cyclase (GGDEF)-like protein